MLSKVALSKVSLAAFASLHLATSAAWTVTNPKAEDESSPVSAPWVRFNPSQKVEVSLNSTASGTLSNKTTEPLEVDAKQTSLSLIEQLPPEVLLHIFSYFSLKELSQVALVSSYFKEVSKTAPSWKEMSFKLGIIDESFANTDLNYKAIVIAAFDPAFIDPILNRIHMSIIESIFPKVKKDSIMRIHSLFRFCRLGDKKTLLKAGGEVVALSRCFCSGAGKELINIAARELNEALIAQGDKDATIRKIKGLENGRDGYEKSPAAARELNEALIAQGDKGAIKRKIDGLIYGWGGYEKDPNAAREFNDALVAKGDSEAIQRKVARLNSNSETPWKNYIDCLEMTLGFTDSLKIVSESPEKAYFNCLDAFSQRIKQLRSEP
ncbi:MAG: F-box protein [Caedimonadaceae bacterium]|nr:MAG: F-box protein [Caedimonadaceae bacterium]